MHPRPLLALLALLATLDVTAAQQKAAAPRSPDPRTPIDVVHTPGDADSIFRIDRPGSYYLTRPLQGRPGKRGIEIAASGVTVDLMGFSLSGVSHALDGIAAVGFNRRALTIRNGNVHSWPGDGLELSKARMVRVQDVTTWSNGGHGIEVGELATLTNCFFDDNGEDGLHGEKSVRVVDSLAAYNGNDGMFVQQSGSFAGSLALENGGFGIVGVRSAIQDSIATENQGSGLSGAVVRGSIATDNQQYGISALGVVSQSAAFGNNTGLAVNGVAESNAAMKNNGDGIWTSVFAALVRGNWSYDNGEDGIHSRNGSLAEGNLTRWNNRGLRSDGPSVARGNFANSNTIAQYMWFGGQTLRGPQQAVADGPLLDEHPGVNVED